MRRRQYTSHAVVVFTVLSLLAQSAHAQRQPSAAGTQFSDYGLFAGLDLRFGDLAGDFGAFVGGHAAVLLKSRVYLGVSGAGLVTENTLFSPTPQVTPEPISMGYGGILLGYVVPTSKLLHLTVDVLLGAGAVDVSRDGDSSDGDDEDDAVFLFEPTATVEVKLAPFARIGVGASYRFVGNLDLPGLRDDDLRGFAGVTTIRGGKF